MSKRLQQAIHLHQKGDLNTAITLYRQLLEEEPDHLEARHGLAIVLNQLQQPEAALHELKLAVKSHPQEASLYNSLGNVYQTLHKMPQAIEAYQNALRINPHYAAALNNQGKCFYALEKFDSAEASYQKALQTQPDFVDALYNLALLHAKQKQLEKSLTLLNRCLQQKPNYNAAIGLKAEVCMQLEKFPDAIDCYLARSQLQPNQADHYHRLGQAYTQNQQLDEAILAFEKAISLNDKHSECYHDLATAFLIKGDHSKALNYFFRQLEIKPLAQTYYNMGVLFLQENRLHDALQYLKYAGDLAPDYLPIHINLGGLYLKLGDNANGIVHYQKALEIGGHNAEIEHILAALTAENSPDKAPSEYIEHLFNQYATYYDKHLKHLEYKVPEKLRAAINEEIGISGRQWQVLDLGCGTGLSGQSFRDVARLLIGIDLSKEMIASAREKKLYDELHVMEVTEALLHFKNIDLIVAADVFTYIGDLEPLFAAAQQALKPDDYFIFSVEAGHIESYQLQQSVRYAHSKKYLQRLIEKYHFTVCRLDNLVLRKQKGEPVQGYLVLLKR